MILTITMNPSVDISYQLDSFKYDSANRVSNVSKTAGGKGINVTRVLSQLDKDVTATGLTGGILGRFIEASLKDKGIKNSFYEVSGATRNCIAFLHEGNQTEILESGPIINREEIDGFITHLETLLPKCELVSISGSLPKGVDYTFYSELIEIFSEHEKRVVTDCSGEALREVIKGRHKPMLIKPNLEELSELIGLEVAIDNESLKNAVSTEIFDGIDWTFVSLGADGAFARNEGKFYRVKIPKIRVINPVGSGDSTVAGIASAIVENKSAEELLKHSNTLGMLNAQQSVTGHVDLSNYEEIYKKIEIIEV